MLALKSFREHDCAPGPSAQLSVEVKNPSVTHTLVVHSVEDWLNGGAKSPKEAMEKRRSRGIARRLTAIRFCPSPSPHLSFRLRPVK